MNYFNRVFCATAGLLLLLSGGCIPADAPAYLKFEDIPADGWPADYQLEFPIGNSEADTLCGHDYSMTLIMRTPARHAIKSIPLVVTCEDSNGAIRSDTIIINSDSRNVTKHREYGVCEYGILINDKLRITPGLTVTLSPLVDETKSRGILNAGLRLDERK